MRDEMLVEVERALKIIIGWGGITRRDGDEEQQTGV